MTINLALRQRSRISLLVLSAAIVLGVQLLLRGWAAWHCGMYWDDLVLQGRLGSYGLINSLLLPHDGHFMPGGFLLAALAVKLQPLGFIPVLLEVLVLQALASCAVLQLLRILLGWRPLTIVLFSWYCFTPLTLTTVTWWSAALNALPLHAGVAWCTTCTVLVVRASRPAVRSECGALFGFLLALLFFEKALLIPYASLGIGLLSLQLSGHHRPWHTLVKRARRLLCGYFLIGAVWISLYLGTPQPRFQLPSLRVVYQSVWHTIGQGLIPSIFGGPLLWNRQPPSTALAHTPWFLTTVSLVFLLVALLFAVLRLPHAAGGLLLFSGYVSACVGSMMMWRSSIHSDTTLGLSLRYVSDCSVIFVTLLALFARSTPRLSIRPHGVYSLVCAACCLSVFSTVTYVRCWSDNPTQSYLSHAQRELTRDSTTPLLDQAVPFSVLSWLSYPDNLISHVFSSVPHLPPIRPYTTELRFMDDSGHLVPGEVSYTREIRQGPEPHCGYFLAPNSTLSAPLSGPLLPWEWTARINYSATHDGLITVQLDSGTAQTIPVHHGLGVVYVQLSGGGEHVHLTSRSSTLSLCLGAGPIGTVWPHRPPA